jgi:hypothetical protein
MRDLLYVAGTIAFFALMLAYVAGCERLGHASDIDAADDADVGTREKQP